MEGNTYSFSMEKRDVLLESMSTKDIRNFKTKKAVKIAIAGYKKELHLLSRKQFEAEGKE